MRSCPQGDCMQDAASADEELVLVHWVNLQLQVCLYIYCLYTYIHTYMHTCIHTYIHTYIHA